MSRALTRALAAVASALLSAIAVAESPAPVDVGPFFAAQSIGETQLAAHAAASGDQAGYSVAMSSDGLSAVVGAVGANGGTGAAYVFRRQSPLTQGGRWDLEATLVADDGAAGDRFGAAIAFDGASEMVFVGAPDATVLGNVQQGAVYCFVRTGLSWVQAIKTSGDFSGDRFGTSVAFSSAGSTLLVGAPGAASGQGAAYAFSLLAIGALPQGVLVASDGMPDDAFGSTVSLAADGDLGLVGAPGSASAAGAGYVFVWDGAEWVQQARIVATDAASGDQFGASVALSGDGNTGLLGAPGADVGTSVDQGAAYVFLGTAGSWNQQQKLVVTDGSGSSGDAFGTAVSLSGDGAKAVIGAPLAGDGYSARNGSAYVFTSTAGLWSEQTASNIFLGYSDAGQVDARYGGAVTMAYAGGALLVGATGADVINTQPEIVTESVGTAFALEVEGNGWLQDYPPLLAVERLYGFVALDDTGRTAATSGGNFIGYDDALYLYARSAGTWKHDLTILLDDVDPTDTLGPFTLAGDGDTLLVLSDFSSAQVAANVFSRSDGTWSAPARVTANDGKMYDVRSTNAALSGDGTVALFARQSAVISNQNRVGAAYIYTRDASGVWSLQAELFDPQGEDISGGYGYSVALSRDGSTLLVSAPGLSAGVPGMVYVYGRLGTSWLLEQVLQAVDGFAGDDFGVSISISADGSVALVGADGLAAAYVFSRPGNQWAQAAKLVAVDKSVDDIFGASVSLSADGRTALVGGDNANGESGVPGRAYLFNEDSNGAWVKTELAAGSDLPDDGFGSMVALSGNAAFALVSATGGNVSTAVYVFAMDTLFANSFEGD